MRVVRDDVLQCAGAVAGAAGPFLASAAKELEVCVQGTSGTVCNTQSRRNNQTGSLVRRRLLAGLLFSTQGYYVKEKQSECCYGGNQVLPRLFSPRRFTTRRRMEQHAAGNQGGQSKA